MIKLLFKYGVFVYLINTIFLSIEVTFNLGNYIFLGIMALFGMLIFINPIQIREVLFHKAFSFLVIINSINFVYWLLFHDIGDIEALKYLLARGVQFSIISLSVYYHFNYYKIDFIVHLCYIIFGIIILGVIVNPYIFSGRYSGIIWNPNQLSSLSSIAFAILFLKEGRKTNFHIFLLFIFLLISLATGSRGVIIAITLAFLFKYGLSIRNIVYAVIGVISFFVFTNLQLETSFNRIYSQGLFNDRTLQYYYALETLVQNPWSGYGLDKYVYINEDIIPDYLKGHIISAHNGYLALLVQYGLIFGSIILFIIFRKIFILSSSLNSTISNTKVYYYIIVYGLVASMYETLITGINEFHTILFWFSLAFLSFSKFQLLHED